jgi:hypothetical protein
LRWLQHLTTKHSALAPEDRLVFGEYYALLMDKLQRRGVTGIVRRPVELKRRQQDQPPAVITHAWKAQQWLPQGFMHLTDRKRPQIAAVAVARELVGFLWQ